MKNNIAYEAAVKKLYSDYSAMYNMGKKKANMKKKV